MKKALVLSVDEGASEALRKTLTDHGAQVVTLDPLPGADRTAALVATVEAADYVLRGDRRLLRDAWIAFADAENGARDREGIAGKHDLHRTRMAIEPGARGIRQFSARASTSARVAGRSGFAGGQCLEA